MLNCSGQMKENNNYAFQKSDNLGDLAVEEF